MNHNKEWEEELKQEQLAEARKEGRRLARRADQSRAHGHTVGICEASCFFLSRHRLDIAQALLERFMIGREKTESALQADKRERSITLAVLDKAGVWEVTKECII